MSNINLEGERCRSAKSQPLPDFSSATALIFVLLTTLFLADAVKQAVVLRQYRR